MTPGPPIRALPERAPRARVAAPVRPRTATDGVIALQRSAGNRTARRLLRQVVPAAAPTSTTMPAPTPRTDYVFIMGSDTDGFYTFAERYFRAHVSGATFVTTARTLEDVLQWVVTNVAASDPVGHLYIVSHANEDGTLSFGLNASDTDHHLTAAELRAALHPATGTTSLPAVGARLDTISRVHVKGCDIGRTQSMVELIDEAFGGAATVTAPTHEQVYGTDPTLGARAGAAFDAAVAASHPATPAVDPALRGRERTAATAARRTAERQRQRDIAAEIASRGAERAATVELAGTYEAMSGPMFQRPGATPFTSAEITPEVDRLYPHLTAARRAALVRGLVAADQRTTAAAHAAGTFRQRGQRSYRYRPFTQTFSEPRTVPEATRLVGDQYPERFVPTSVRSTRVAAPDGTFRVRFVIAGQIRERGRDPQDHALTFTTDPVPSDASILDQGHAQRSNPDRYAWRVEETHSADGTTIKAAVAERVVAYLHHESLDASAHSHFDRPLTDRDFYAESTFAPPAPAGTP